MRYTARQLAPIQPLTPRDPRKRLALGSRWLFLGVEVGREVEEVALLLLFSHREEAGPGPIELGDGGHVIAIEDEALDICVLGDVRVVL